MTNLDFSNLFGPITVTEPTDDPFIPDGCQCPVTGTRAYELTIDAGSLFLTCITCGESLDTDLHDYVSTGEAGLPITITWTLERRGFEDPDDELYGTANPEATKDQLTEARDLASALLLTLAHKINNYGELTNIHPHLDFDAFPDWLTAENRGITTWQREPAGWDETTLADIDPDAIRESDDHAEAVMNAYEPGPDQDEA
jgi:hypothetical protein